MKNIADKAWVQVGVLSCGRDFDNSNQLSVKNSGILKYAEFVKLKFPRLFRLWYICLRILKLFVLFYDLYVLSTIILSFRLQQLVGNPVKFIFLIKWFSSVSCGNLDKAYNILWRALKFVLP